MAIALARPSLAESCLNVRDNLLANQKFQNWAARFPLTRRIARREARALFDLCAGFVYAQTLSACITLDLFEMLGPGPLSVETLSARCNVPVPALTMLLNAAASLRLLAVTGKKFRLGQLGAALRGNPGVAAMVAHHRLFYADLADPVALLRGEADTALSRFWPYRGQAGDAAGYSALMAATQPMIAAEILAAYDFSRHRILLDVGGGDGAFLAALAPRARHLDLRLFDLPDVAARATVRFQTTGPTSAAAFSGNIFCDSLPEGADIITLIRVLHDHDDDAALKILLTVRAALPPGSTLLLAEPVAGTAGAEPVGDVYFGFYLLAMGSGRARRLPEIRTLLTAAGFTAIKTIPTTQPMLTSLMAASVSFS